MLRHPTASATPQMPPAIQRRKIPADGRHASRSGTPDPEPVRAHAIRRPVLHHHQAGSPGRRIPARTPLATLGDAHTQPHHPYPTSQLPPSNRPTPHTQNASQWAALLRNIKLRPARAYAVWRLALLQDAPHSHARAVLARPHPCAPGPRLLPAGKSATTLTLAVASDNRQRPSKGDASSANSIQLWHACRARIPTQSHTCPCHQTAGNTVARQTKARSSDRRTRRTRLSPPFATRTHQITRIAPISDNAPNANCRPMDNVFTSDRSSPPSHQRQRSHLQLLRNQQQPSKGDAPNANSRQCRHSRRAATPLLTRASLSRFAVNYRQSQRQPFRPRQLPHHVLRHAAPSRTPALSPKPTHPIPRPTATTPLSTLRDAHTQPHHPRGSHRPSDAPIEERRPKRKMPPSGAAFLQCAETKRPPCFQHHGGPSAPRRPEGRQRASLV